MVAPHWLSDFQSDQCQQVCQKGNHPEPDDDLVLRPFFHLKMVVDRCHLKDPFVAKLVTANL